MERRGVPSILEEWRAVERELDVASDDEAREYLQARIAGLRAEYAAALSHDADVVGHQQQPSGPSEELGPDSEG